MDQLVTERLVVPGDVVLRDEDIKHENQNITIKVGGGIARNSGKLIATRAGRVRFETKTSIWLDCRCRWVS